MKIKLVFILLLLFTVVGCEKMINTPVGKVEEYLQKYQRLDNSVINEINTVINKNKNLSKEDKKEYKKLLEKQYQNLSYKIKDEDIYKDMAEVLVEIEVLDYKEKINSSKKYYKTHKEEFFDKNYTKYKLNEMKKAKSKIKYDIEFYLNKIDGVWEINNPQEEDIQKLHGLY